MRVYGCTVYKVGFKVAFDNDLLSVPVNSVTCSCGSIKPQKFEAAYPRNGILE